MPTAVLLATTLLGIIAGMAAGGCQQLTDIDGVYISDMVHLFAWGAPPQQTAKAVLRIGGRLPLDALAGGVAVPVFAGMAAVSWLHGRAERISAPLTTTPEDVL